MRFTLLCIFHGDKMFFVSARYDYFFPSERSGWEECLHANLYGHERQQVRESGVVYSDRKRALSFLKEDGVLFTF
jgi:hypothetical protein